MDLDHDLEEEDVDPTWCFCGLMLDPGQLWCGIDPSCAHQARMEYGDADPNG